MQPLLVFWLIACFWFVVNTLRVAVVCISPTMLERLFTLHGLGLGMFSVEYQTRVFNRFINTLRPKQFLSVGQYALYKRYYRLGYWMSIIALPFMVIKLIELIWASSFIAYIWTGFAILLGQPVPSASIASTTKSIEENVMVLIPGIGVPIGNCVVFLLALAFASAFHELGHALAANRHKIKVDTVGIGLVVCFVVTYVRLKLPKDEDEDEDKGDVRKVREADKLRKQKMDVASAGILNNALLCLLTMMVITFNPMSVFYTNIEKGMLVSQVDKMASIANGPNRLEAGDVILSVNHRALKREHDWREHLERLATEPVGLCLLNVDIEALQLEEQYACDFGRCCGDDDESSLCFLMPLNGSRPIEVPPQWPCDPESELGGSNLQRYYRLFKRRGRRGFIDHHRKVCFSARRLSQLSHEYCNALAKCSPTYYGEARCLLPYSAHPTMRLIIVGVQGKPDIIFFGPTTELYQSLVVSPIRPHWPSLLSLWLYWQWEAFLNYLFLVSYTMIVFNLLPFTTFDGYHIFALTVEHYLGSVLTKQRRGQIVSVANTVSAFIVSTIIMMAVFHLRHLF